MKTRIIAVLPTDKKFKMSTLYSLFFALEKNELWAAANYGKNIAMFPFSFTCAQNSNLALHKSQTER